MKLGYFSHTNFSVSETFIYDLVKMLSNDKEIDLKYYSGQVSGEMVNDFNLNYSLTGFSEKANKWGFRKFKIGQLFGKGYAFKMAHQRKVAKKMITKSVNSEIDLAYVDYATSGVWLMDYFHEKNIPFVVHVHGYDVTSALNDPEYAKSFNVLAKRASFFIAASNHIRQILILTGVEAKKIKVIKYGLESKGLVYKPYSERVAKGQKVIFLGRLTPKKNPVALIESYRIVAEKHPDTKFSIIGDGPLLGEVKERISRYNLSDKVELLGALPREKAFPIMAEHTIFTQHSVTAPNGDQEGYALSPAEAALHEIPVVSTIHNGIPEHVIDGETGFLVPEFNFEAMADKISELIENPELAEEMGKAGRLNIIELNSNEKRLNEMKSLFNQVLVNVKSN